MAIIKRAPHPDEAAILKAAAQQLDVPARRRFGKQLLSLGGLSMLTGCAITDNESVETALSSVSRFNDKVQGWLFDPNQLAPTFPDSMITKPFPFNAFYDESRFRRSMPAATPCASPAKWRRRAAGPCQSCAPCHKRRK